MKKLLLSPDPAEGGAAPPAADIVLKTPAIEEADAAALVQTRRELEAERKDRKKEQTRISELEDENRRLKNIPNLAPEKAKEQKKSFLSGLSDLADSI